MHVLLERTFTNRSMISNSYIFRMAEVLISSTQPCVKDPTEPIHQNGEIDCAPERSSSMETSETTPTTNSVDTTLPPTQPSNNSAIVSSMPMEKHSVVGDTGCVEPVVGFKRTLDDDEHIRLDGDLGGLPITKRRRTITADGSGDGVLQDATNGTSGSHDAINEDMENGSRMAAEVQNVSEEPVNRTEDIHADQDFQKDNGKEGGKITGDSETSPMESEMAVPLLENASQSIELQPKARESPNEGNTVEPPKTIPDDDRLSDCGELNLFIDEADDDTDLVLPNSGMSDMTESAEAVLEKKYESLDDKTDSHLEDEKEEIEPRPLSQSTESLLKSIEETCQNIEKGLNGDFVVKGDEKTVAALKNLCNQETHKDSVDCSKTVEVDESIAPVLIEESEMPLKIDSHVDENGSQKESEILTESNLEDPTSYTAEDNSILDNQDSSTSNCGLVIDLEESIRISNVEPTATENDEEPQPLDSNEEENVPVLESDAPSEKQYTGIASPNEAIVVNECKSELSAPIEGTSEPLEETSKTNSKPSVEGNYLKQSNQALQIGDDPIEIFDESLKMDDEASKNSSGSNKIVPGSSKATENVTDMEYSNSSDIEMLADDAAPIEKSIDPLAVTSEIPASDNQRATTTAIMDSTTTPINFETLSELKRTFRDISREGLEALIMEKIIEAIVQKSRAASNAKRIVIQEQQMAKMKEKLVDMQRQFVTIELMYKSVSDQVKNHEKNGCKVTPKPVSRTVCIQTQGVLQMKCKSCGSKSASTASVNGTHRTPSNAQKPSVENSSPVTVTLLPPPKEVSKTTNRPVNGKPATNSAPVQEMVVDLTEDEEASPAPVKSAPVAGPARHTANTSNRHTSSHQSVPSSAARESPTSLLRSSHPAPIPTQNVKRGKIKKDDKTCIIF